MTSFKAITGQGHALRSRSKVIDISTLDALNETVNVYFFCHSMVKLCFVPKTSAAKVHWPLKGHEAELKVHNHVVYTVLTGVFFFTVLDSTFQYIYVQSRRLCQNSTNIMRDAFTFCSV